MNKHAKLMASLKKYNPLCQILLKKGKFFNGDTVEISKNILLENIDTLDSYDSGLMKGNILIEYGSDFANIFIDIVKESMKEIKFKGK